MGFFSPQAEQVWLVATKRPIRTKCFPAHSALYLSICTNSLQSASEMALDRWRFLTMPLMFKSSTAITSWFLTIAVEDLWAKSFRQFLTLA